MHHPYRATLAYRLVACAVGIFLFGVCAGSTDAAFVQLSNPGFDSPPGVSLIGDVTRNPITNDPAGTWILGGGDNADKWDLDVSTGEAYSDPSPGEAQGMSQWVIDGGATTGTAKLNFDLFMDTGSGGGDYDLFLYVFGWNNGSSAPGVDYENGTAETGDSFIPNASVNLITDLTGSEGRFTLINNGVATTEGTAAGVVDDATFRTISVNVDFNPGYDNIGVLFYAENSISDGALRVDNVQFVPEPGSAVLGLLACLTISARRRRILG